VGIDRGMKRLSDLNMYLVVILTLFVFIAGATVFVLNYMLESTGLYLREFIFQSLWTDTFSEAEGWLGAWTVFYWAWWISWSPFVGGFIARISRGRTIREFVVGVLVFPTVMSFVFITVMGGNAIYFDMQGASGIAEAIGVNISFSLFALFENLPFTQLFSVVALILITVFFITSADAATGVCAQMTTGGRAETPGILKVFWGVILGAVSAFLLIAGGLQALQTASIVVAFPFIAVCIGLMVAFVRALTNPVEPPVWITKDEPVNDRVGPVPGLTEEPPPE
jgi:choline-glycine betaine transporter